MTDLEWLDKLYKEVWKVVRMTPNVGVSYDSMQETRVLTPEEWERVKSIIASEGLIAVPATGPFGLTFCLAIYQVSGWSGYPGVPVTALSHLLAAFNETQLPWADLRHLHDGSGWAAFEALTHTPENKALAARYGHQIREKSYYEY